MTRKKNTENSDRKQVSQLSEKWGSIEDEKIYPSLLTPLIEDLKTLAKLDHNCGLNLYIAKVLSQHIADRSSLIEWAKTQEKK